MDVYLRTHSRENFDESKQTRGGKVASISIIVIFKELKITSAKSLISTPHSSRLAISDPGAGHVKPIIAAKCSFIRISGLLSSGRAIRWNSKGTTIFSYSDIRTYDTEMSIQQFSNGVDCFVIL